MKPIVKHFLFVFFVCISFCINVENVYANRLIMRPPSTHTPQQNNKLHSKTQKKSSKNKKNLQQKEKNHQDILDKEKSTKKDFNFYQKSPSTYYYQYSNPNRVDTLSSSKTFVDIDCILDASQRFDVPLSMILSILDVEKGSVGKKSINSNNTYDIGPMQINTIHLHELQKMGISKIDLVNNGCININVGTWLLKKHLNASNNSFFEAVGRYHSTTPKYKRAYQRRVIQSYKMIRQNPLRQIDTIIQKCNQI